MFITLLRVSSSALISLFLIISSSSFAYNPDIEKFKQSWVAYALKLQRAIDVNIPFNQATFLGTHNSENSKSYAIPLLRYVDPNQTLSIYEQLELGIRSIEFDVHWTLSRGFHNEILLCHGLDNHVGCSIYDRPVVQGLQEVKKWLLKNPGEIIFLYFDRTLDGHEPRLAQYLNQYLGSFIFKPTLIKSPSDHNCTPVPMQLTKKKILALGKQILIVTKRCDGTHPNYKEQDKFPLLWNDYVFAGMGNTKPDAYTILDSSYQENFPPYPSCLQTPAFPQDFSHENMWRIFEDRTKLSNRIKPHRMLLAEDIRDIMRCQVNLPTLDMLTIGDERLTAAIWSWAPNYPKRAAGNCAVYAFGEGIKNFPCNEFVFAFACRKENSASFEIAVTKGTFRDGENVCQTYGHDLHFTMPFNSYEMQMLKNKFNSHTPSLVAIYYAMNDRNEWTPGS